MLVQDGILIRGAIADCMDKFLVAAQDSVAL